MKHTLPPRPEDVMFRELVLTLARKLAKTDPEVADRLADYDLEVIYQRRAARARVNAYIASSRQSECSDESGAEDSGIVKLQHLAGWM